jgi:hypothetical protein
MTRPRDFQHMAKYARQMIINNDSLMKDYRLMEELKLTPTSWKVWKPLLIQKYSSEKYNCTNNNKEETYQIDYIKKTKMWLVTLID